MGSLIIFLFVARLGLQVFAYPSTSDHLDEKLRQTKIEIARLHFREESSVPRKLYNVQWDVLWQEKLSAERPFTVIAFNGALLVDGSNVITLSLDVPPSNQSLSQKLTLTRRDGSIKFVRSIVWKNVLYLLVCHDTCTCSLYTGSDNYQLRHRQTVRLMGCPTDASFFVRANRLYLVVADNSGKFTVPSLIFHWRGTYMDIVAEAMTTDAVSVTTFRHKQSTIIVFAQADKSYSNTGSVVYEFKETSTDRIQFLSTLNPASVHHYNHAGFNFILLTNEQGPSNLFWWDGQELLNWQQIPEIEGNSLVHALNVDNNTFFLVARENILQLYKFENASDCAFVSSRKLSDGETVTDVRLKIDGSTLIAMLITVSQGNVYGLESWELRIKEIPSDHSIEESDVLSKHLSELVEMLQERRPLVEKAEASWPFFLPANENLTITEPISLANIELVSGTVGNVDVFVDKDVIAPGELEKNLEDLVSAVDDTLRMSKSLLSFNNTNTLTGNILINGDAFIEKLQIDSADVNFLNNVDIQSNYGVISSNGNEESLAPLRGDNIVVDNVQVESLCGIPFEYWAIGEDRSKIEINLEADKIEFTEDTVHLSSNFSVNDLKVKILNDINIMEFLGELFIIGGNQKIKGDLTFDSHVVVGNFTFEMLNGKPFENYITANTNQSFDQYSLTNVRIGKLYADKINGVPVSEAARVSRANVIQGDVKIANLQVTEKLTADSGFTPTKSNPLQIYFNVTIYGDLTIKALDFIQDTKIFLNGEELKLSNIFDEYWTKSTDQVIQNDVTFENNLTIDHLNASLLNGRSDQDFLYTTLTIIPENFPNIHFENVYIDDTFVTEKSNFFENAPESLTVKGKLHVKHLRGKKLFADVFNGLPVKDMLNGKPNFPETTNFPTIRAKRVKVEDLHFVYLNDKDSGTFFESALNPAENTNYTKIPELTVENLIVDRVNDLDMQKVLLLRDIRISELKNLIIDGDLTVKGDLKIDRIDNESPEISIKNMVKEDIIIDTDESIDELIVHNATLRFLHDYKVNDLFENVLSRSREQSIPGKFNFYRIKTNSMEARFINDQDTLKLAWVDEPLILTGNVTFDDLIVEGNITTSIVNGRDVNELYEDLLKIPATRINNLEVNGNIFWNESAINSTHLTFLFEHAVTKDTDQIIHGDTIFVNDVSVGKLEVKQKEVNEISDILADAVIDDDEVIEVAGEKTFKNDITIDDLSVAGDVNVQIINNIDILQFNESVVRKDQDETISRPLTFLEEVVINEISVNDSMHDVPLDGLVFSTDTLPSNVTFKHLVVLQDVSLKNLDRVDFEEFLQNRVTIDGDHEIDSDVQFNGIIEVTGNANVSSINGIGPFDLVIDGKEEAQIISGAKSFANDIVVTNNIQASLVNGVDVLSEYSNGIRNDEDVKIIGDLVFESEVRVPENVSVSGLINEVNLPNILSEIRNETKEYLQAFEQNEIKIENSIKESSLIAHTLGNIFSYLEAEKKLKIRVPNIRKVQVVNYQGITKLNMFGEEAGALCGLPDNCSCPVEYVAELEEDDCRVSRTNTSAILRNYHEMHSTFGVNVMSNTVSNSPECTSNKIGDEFTTISWMKPGMIETGDLLAHVQETTSKIHGFVKDAATFMTYDNAAYVVLAIHYDPLQATHRTDSLIYKIDFDSNRLSLHQQLPTDGAWAIEIFKTNQKDMYLLLGCFGESEKSFLYKFDPSTSMFTTLRSFDSKSRNVKSLSREEEKFVLLDDFETNAVNIFYYDKEFDNFYSYQSIFHDSRVNTIECFYADEFGRSDSFIVVTTENDQFYIYEYMFVQRFRLKVRHRMDDLQAMVPFDYLGNRYIFAGTKKNSTILRIVQQGPR